jgi:hypothetical protein
VCCTDVETVAMEYANELRVNVVACSGEVTIADGMHGLGYWKEGSSADLIHNTNLPSLLL